MPDHDKRALINLHIACARNVLNELDSPDDQYLRRCLNHVAMDISAAIDLLDNDHQ